MSYKNIIKLLEENSDEEYKLFHQKLKAEGNSKIYGVRVPKLREISKTILKDDPHNFINNIRFDSYEEKVLYGMVISSLKCNFLEKLDLISTFVPQIDSWAVCDVVSFKVTKEQKPLMWKYIQEHFKSKQEFPLRFAIVNSMSNFLDNEYIDKTLSIYEGIKSDYYYVNMALAWALQVAFVKDKKKVCALFEKGTISKDVTNKAIGKLRDSRRVTPQDKENILKYKIKN